MQRNKINNKKRDEKTLASKAISWQTRLANIDT